MEQNYIIANRTDTGATRDVNEDSMVTFDSPNGRVVAVCDGMGGQAAGDLASNLACDIIRDILENNTFSTPTEAITRAVMAANQGILHRASTDPNLQGMGATCVIVIIKDGLVYYGWVGDSRIYYYSNGVLRQISRDQSYVQQLVDAGQISAEEAEHHPQKNEITNALGLDTMTPPELCTAPLTPEPGSIIMLCSDGLSGMVGDAGMQQILAAQGMTLQQKTESLVSAANAAGGLDNITVQLIEFTGGAVGGGAGYSANMAPARQAAQPALRRSNRMMTYICFVLIAIIAAVAIGMWIGKDDTKKKDTPQAESTSTMKDDRTTVKPKENKVTTTTTTTTTTETKTRESAPSQKTTPKSNSPKGSAPSKKPADQLMNSQKKTDKTPKSDPTINPLDAKEKKEPGLDSKKPSMKEEIN